MVDDQPAKLLTYESMLSQMGERLIKAETAGEALSHLLKEDIAVVLMDVNMPELDGFELAAMIRQHPRCRRTAILFVSAVHLTDLDRVRGYAAGAVDYVSVPVNPEGKKVADSWDPAKDAAAGEQCRAFGGGAIMRMPGRIRIAWSDDTTLKVETEAGTQTRAFAFGAVQAGEPSWQGVSAATWQPAGGGGGRRGGGPPRGGSLKVVTTNLRPGYLRRNGVPYSANARVTEYFNRVNEANGDSWLIVTTMVEDPQYLNARFVTSSHFKKVPDDAPWKPTACE